MTTSEILWRFLLQELEACDKEEQLEIIDDLFNNLRKRYERLEKELYT